MQDFIVKVFQQVYNYSDKINLADAYGHLQIQI